MKNVIVSKHGLFIVMASILIQLAYDLARIEIEGWMPMKGKMKVLVNSDTRMSLKNIPGWAKTHFEKFGEMSDESRPEGWGSVIDEEEKKQGIFAGGIHYETDQMISGTFEIQQTKGEVYGNCVQLILSDMIRKIENENHKLTITIEDALGTLKTALLASN